MDREQEILRRLREAVEAGRPEVLDAVMAATREPPPPRRHSGPPVGRLVRRAGLLGMAAALLIIVCQMTELGDGSAPEPVPPADSLAQESNMPIRETGYQVRALSTEEGEAAIESCDLVPDEPVAAATSVGEEPWDCLVGARLLADGRIEYKTHVSFSVLCEGEGIESIRYTVNAGQLERRVSLDTPQAMTAYGGRVDHINVSDGKSWGYLPLGVSRTIPYAQQYEENGAIGLQLAVVRDRAVETLELQQLFAAMIHNLRLTVSVYFADGSMGRSVIGLQAASTVTGGLNVVLCS